LVVWNVRKSLGGPGNDGRPTRSDGGGAGGFRVPWSRALFICSETFRYFRCRRSHRALRPKTAYDYVRGYVSGREARGDVSNGMQTRFPGGTRVSGWSRSECVRVYGQSEPHERAQYISVCRRNGGSDSALSAAPVQLSAGRGPSRESATRGVLERFFRLKSSIFELFSVQHDV